MKTFTINVLYFWILVRLNIDRRIGHIWKHRIGGSALCVEEDSISLIAQCIRIIIKDGNTRLIGFKVSIMS